MKYSIAIIGAGPAGIAAALQLQRFGINVLLFEQCNFGSLLNNAWNVENYLGVYPGESGIKLLQRFRTILVKNKLKEINSKVETLDYNPKSQLFKIKTPDKIYHVRQVIVASGTKPKVHPKLKVIDDILAPYVHYEVFPLLKKRNNSIVIIGAGDAAFDNALNLAKYNQVVIYNRSKVTNALPLLVKEVSRKKNIAYYRESSLDSINFEFPKKLQIKFTARGKLIVVNADYLLVAIGRVSQKDFYAPALRLREKQLIKLGKLFLVGDVKNNLYRQVAIAVSDGIVAAMRIFHKLKR